MSRRACAGEEARSQALDLANAEERARGRKGERAELRVFIETVQTVVAEYAWRRCRRLSRVVCLKPKA